MATDCDKIKIKYNRHTPNDENEWTNPTIIPNITQDDIFKCTGLCGPNHYIKVDNDLEPPGTCEMCQQRPPNGYEGGMVQCENTSESWYENQVELNMLKKNFNWMKTDKWAKFYPDKIDNNKNINEITNEELQNSDFKISECTKMFNSELNNSEEPEYIQNKSDELDLSVNDILKSCEILSDYLITEQPLGDNEILSKVGCDFTMLDEGANLTNVCGHNIDELRDKIHSNRGDQIPISNIVMKRWAAKYNELYNEPESENIPQGYTLQDLINNSGGNYTKKHIIRTEIDDYISDKSLQKKVENPLSIDIGKIYSNLKLNTDFETCMDTILDINFKNKKYCGNKSQEEIENDISNLKSILNLQDCHLDYIEDRLKTIATLNLGDVDLCLKNFNLIETFNCDESISDKMLTIAYLIFHLIGFDSLDMSQIKEGTADYTRLKTIIDRLTPLIKPSIYRIIQISKHYEKQTCGKESITTHLLERIYKDFFNTSLTNNIDISNISIVPDNIKYGDMQELSKTVIWILSLAFFIYIILKGVSLLG
jgi:hypothetical protein